MSYQPKPFRCVGKSMDTRFCGQIVNMVSWCCGQPYLSIYSEDPDRHWDLQGYIPEEDGMILGAAADLYNACELALAEMSRDTKYPETVMDALRSALKKARGE